MGETALRYSVSCKVSDAPQKDQYPEGNCPPGNVIGPTSSTLGRPCRILQRAPTFTRKRFTSSLGGEVKGPSEMIRRKVPALKFRAPLTDMSPVMIGHDACESLLTHIWSERAFAGEYLARHILGMQQAW